MKSLPPRLTPRVMPWAVLAIALALSLATAVLAARIAEDRACTRFARVVSEAVAQLRVRMASQIDLLRGVSALMRASDVSRDVFGRYVRELSLAQTFPWVAAIGFAQVYPAGELTSVVEGQGARTGASPARHDGRDSLTTAVTHLEPLGQAARPRLGFDMLAEPVRREAMLRARATGEPALSARMALRAELGEQSAPAATEHGFVLFLPFSHPVTGSGAPSPARPALAGFTYAVFRAEPLFAKMFDDAARTFTLEAYDGPAPRPSELLYATPPSASPLARPGLVETRQITLGGRTWTLRFAARDGLVPLGESLLAPLIASLGVLMSLLLYGLTRSQLAARRAAHAGALALERGEVLRAELAQQERAARREAQERLALIDALFRATPAGLAVFDRELRFVRLNQGLSDINGLPAGAHLGRTVRELFPAMAPSIEPVLREVLERGEARTFEVSSRPLAARDARTWLSNCAPVRDEHAQVVGVAAVVLEITARKRAEHESQELVEALREEREIFDVLNRVGKQIAAELHLERLAQALADAAAKVSSAELAVFVYFGEESSGSPVCALSGTLRETWQATRATDWAALIESVEGRTLRISQLGADTRIDAQLVPPAPPGEPPLASCMVVPLSLRVGKRAAGFVLAHRAPGLFAARDENVLSGLSTQAAIALGNARLYREAEALIQALAQSNRELDQFAYVASHDLKAPLRGIANISHWLEEDLGDLLPRRSREHLRLLQNRVHRLENLIGGILRYSRAGRTHHERETVHVVELVNEVATLLSPPELARVNVGPDLPVLNTERVPLQQVFMNLIGNALKFAKRPDPVIDVAVLDADALWQFQVQDNGPGVAADDRERIWEPFQSRVPSDNGESTGIGLAVVRRTVEARGGRAWVESIPGAGATFCFTWPKHET